MIRMSLKLYKCSFKDVSHFVAFQKAHVLATQSLQCTIRISVGTTLYGKYLEKFRLVCSSRSI